MEVRGEELRRDPLHTNQQNPKTRIFFLNEGTRRSTKRSIAWLAGLASGFQRGKLVDESGSFRATRKRCASGSRYCQFFSWLTNGVASKSGTGFRWAWCLDSFSEGLKLRYLLEDTDNKGLLQKTCWFSRVVRVRKILVTWFLTHHRKFSMQGSESRRQSSVCRRWHKSWLNTEVTILPM